MAATIFLIIGIALLSILLIVFAVLLVIGIRKKKKRFFLLSIIPLLLSIVLLIIGGFVFFGYSTYEKVDGYLEPRTGTEIYYALFGYSDSECVEVLNHQDQTVPVIDFAIALHFKTCPEELSRILNQNDYSCSVMHTENMGHIGTGVQNDWFVPKYLGDSILVFKYVKDEYENMQTLYSNMDSTEVYCLDICD